MSQVDCERSCGLVEGQREVGAEFDALGLRAGLLDLQFRCHPLTSAHGRQPGRDQRVSGGAISIPLDDIAPGKTALDADFHPLRHEAARKGLTESHGRGRARAHHRPKTNAAYSALRKCRRLDDAAGGP